MLFDRRTPALFTFTLLLGAATPALADIQPDPPEDKQLEQDKQDKPDKPDKQDAPAEKTQTKKGGDCSVHDSKLELGGLAALVLLISGVGLRRRRA